jgi:hypothetical protein
LLSMPSLADLGPGTRMAVVPHELLHPQYRI